MIGDQGDAESRQPAHLLIARGLRAQTQTDPVLDRLTLGHLVEVQHRALRQQHPSLPGARSVLRIQWTAGHTAPEPGKLVSTRYGRALARLVQPERFPETARLFASPLFEAPPSDMPDATIADADFSLGLELILDGVAARIGRSES